MQMLILYGLSPLPALNGERESTPAILRRDPISWPFALVPSAIGDVSYAQYVLQILAYFLLPTSYFLPLLLLTS